MHPLFTHDSIEIHAPLSKVWKVLTTVQLLKQWEIIPVDYGDLTHLTVGRTILWKDENGVVQVKGTVLDTFHHKHLKVSLQDLSWKNPPKPEEFYYEYLLEDRNGSTLLTLRMGDFRAIPGGENQFEETKDDTSDELVTIKAFAEKIRPLH